MMNNFVTLYEGGCWSPGSIALYVILVAILIVMWIIYIRWLIYEDQHGRGIRRDIRLHRELKKIHEQEERKAYEREMARRREERLNKLNQKNKKYYESDQSTDSKIKEDQWK